MHANASKGTPEQTADAPALHSTAERERVASCCPFCRGWMDAWEGTVYDPTPRQVEHAHPEYTSGDTAMYCEGVSDCLDNGDVFRLLGHRKD